MSKPNILWIHTDQHRTDSIGCYGSAWAKTPNFDILAETGTLFENAFCQSPVCLPSRTSQLTARYPIETGGLNNPHSFFDFREDLKPFPLIFEEAGYATGSFGKHHTQKGKVWQTWKSILATNKHIDHFGFIDGQHKDEDYGMLKHPGGGHIVTGGTYPDDISNCAIDCVNEGINFINNAQAEEKPFLLRLSIEWPHNPIITPKPFDALYNEDTLPVRFFDKKTLEGRSKFDLGKINSDAMFKLSNAELKSYWRYYMGLAAYVDFEFGRILRLLEDNDLRDNTIIVLSSDHGHLLGENGFSDKDCFDTPAYKVPYIWSWPKHIPQGKREEGIADMLDLPKTLLNLCGLKAQTPSDYKGRDLFKEKAPEASFAQIRCRPTAGMPDAFRYAIRTLEWRMDINFSVYGTELTIEQMDGNLFDIINDPFEEKNLFNKPEYFSIRDTLINKIHEHFSSLDIDKRVLDLSYLNFEMSFEAQTGMKPR